MRAAPPPEEVAAGFLEIAVASMANAIKKISVQRGYDVTRYVLATFGGAGGQHACAVADALGIGEVLIHPLAGVLSAYGMGLADVTAMRERSVEAPLSAALLPELGRVADALAADALPELVKAGAGLPAPDGPGETAGPGTADVADGPAAPAAADGVRQVRRAHLKYEGTDTALPVPLGPLAEMVAAFERAYRQYFSFLMRGKAIIAETVSVELAAPSEPLPAPTLAPPSADGASGGSRPGRETAAAERQPLRCIRLGGGRGRCWPGGGTCGPATGWRGRR